MKRLYLDHFEELGDHFEELGDHFDYRYLYTEQQEV